MIAVLIAGLSVAAPGPAKLQAHGAHVHGAADLAIATDADGRLEAQLQIPADTLYGFEHAARTPDEQRLVETVQARLVDGVSLLRFNAAAACTFGSATLEETGEDQETGPLDSNRHHGDHDAHDDDHGHHDDHDATGHRDVRVTYHFQCERPTRLDRVDTGLFEHFDRLETVGTVFLSPDRQTGFDLTPREPGHSLR